MILTLENDTLQFALHPAHANWSLYQRGGGQLDLERVTDHARKLSPWARAIQRPDSLA